MDGHCQQFVLKMRRNKKKEEEEEQEEGCKTTVWHGIFKKIIARTFIVFRGGI